MWLGLGSDLALTHLRLMPSPLDFQGDSALQRAQRLFSCCLFLCFFVVVVLVFFNCFDFSGLVMFVVHLRQIGKRMVC